MIEVCFLCSVLFFDGSVSPMLLCKVYSQGSMNEENLENVISRVHRAQ